MGKKPLVQPDRRRDWLERQDQGESPNQIAKKDGYDARTVRKQLEMAREEREAKEARAQILRNAIEGHQADLLQYAARLEAQVRGLGPVKAMADAEFLAAALREHLPRSPLWNGLNKLDNLRRTQQELWQSLDQWSEQIIHAEPQISVLMEAGLSGLIPGLKIALGEQARYWSQGNNGPKLADSLVLEATVNGQRQIRYGTILLGQVEAGQAESALKQVAAILASLSGKLKASSLMGELEQTASEISRLQTKLHQELAVIRLRRIVPGHCKYCPL